LESGHWTARFFDPVHSVSANRNSGGGCSGRSPDLAGPRNAESDAYAPPKKTLV